ncbi:MAG TPA: hypothetical protein VJX67_01190 [Blastocatellia bacterium]|nr:hypothetical protein [Blastocatellia bacterium]
MSKHKWTITVGLAIALGTCVACHFSASTAHIGSLKLAKDKAISAETNSFGASDTVFAEAVISNAPGKVKVKGILAVEAVEGQKTGPIPGLETTLDLDGSGTATFNFSPPDNGWPQGKYKVEVTLLDENGEQRDQKAASLTAS